MSLNKERPCAYSQLGCTFTVSKAKSLNSLCFEFIRLTSFLLLKGGLNEISLHERESTPHHLKLVASNITRKRTSLDYTESMPVAFQDLQRKNEATSQYFLVVHREMAKLAEEMDGQLAPLREGLAKLEPSWNEFRESLSELSLMVQTLQATSYNGEFIWKIPEMARRTKEAILGKTISLYSAPFFTSRFGYRLCLRLYLNGDGCGRGTHLSFFLTIMKGEYDALLCWPFQQMVTLMLLDQNKKSNIVQCFRPEPSSPSFWKPKTEMNVALGCPKFAPLSVLNNLSYVRNDTMYLKVIVDKTGLVEP